MSATEQVDHSIPSTTSVEPQQEKCQSSTESSVANKHSRDEDTQTEPQQANGNVTESSESPAKKKVKSSAQDDAVAAGDGSIQVNGSAQDANGHDALSGNDSPNPGLAGSATPLGKSQSLSNGHANGATANDIAKEVPNPAIPGTDEYLEHPERWTTGDDPATPKQKTFIKVLEKQIGDLPVEDGTKSKENLTKAEASEKIAELKSIS